MDKSTDRLIEKTVLIDEDYWHGIKFIKVPTLMIGAFCMSILVDKPFESDVIVKDLEEYMYADPETGRQCFYIDNVKFVFNIKDSDGNLIDTNESMFVDRDALFHLLNFIAETGFYMNKEVLPELKKVYKQMLIPANHEAVKSVLLDAAKEISRNKEEPLC